MSLGQSGTACDFRDSNVAISVEDTLKVTSNFNKIEIRNASSRVDWTNITITALGTDSKGNFEVVENADLNFDGCTFVNMGTFAFLANSAALNCTWRGCDQITAGGADLSGSFISGYEGTSPSPDDDEAALVWNVATSPASLLADMTFTKGTASTHAIEFGASAPQTFTLSNITFTGYNASNGQLDSTLFFRDTGGDVTWSVTIDGGTEPSYTKERAGDTVNIITGSVTVTLTGLQTGSEVRVYDQGTGDAIDGVESSSTSFAFSDTAANVVDIRIFHLSYLPADIEGFTIPASNTSIPVQQVFDRNYNNP
jgi:hypothetical protein